MIKKYLHYIKEENHTEDFQIDDVVICIDGDTEQHIVLNNAYKIENKRSAFSDDQIKLFDVEFHWYVNRFRLATSEEREDYIIKKTSNKYNL